MTQQGNTTQHITLYHITSKLIISHHKTLQHSTIPHTQHGTDGGLTQFRRDEIGPRSASEVDTGQCGEFKWAVKVVLEVLLEVVLCVLLCGV
jgi:hypothetical protein